LTRKLLQELPRKTVNEHGYEQNKSKILKWFSTELLLTVHVGGAAGCGGAGGAAV
jgi:hypothetical protein